MSVFVLVKIKADKAAFERTIKERGDDMVQIASRGRAAGALHHRFGVNADGTVVVVDEWTSEEAFRKFFADPEIGKIMQDSGAQGEPEFLIVEAIETPDQF